MKKHTTKKNTDDRRRKPFSLRLKTGVKAGDQAAMMSAQAQQQMQNQIA